MKFATLPGADRQASRIVLGTAWFGTAIPEDHAFRLMDSFVENGGNFLDTAHMYAGWVPGGAGKSETTIGKWLKRAGRGNVVIATKGADKGMTREGIRAQLGESLDRLGLERVDFYWLHTDHPKVPVEDIVEWLNELTDEGRFPAFGCSNWSVPRIQKALEYARQRGKRGFSASQIAWSLARADPAVSRGGPQVFMDDETLAFHQQSGFPQIAFSSQAGGFFAGNYDPAGPPPGVEPNANIVRYYGTKANYARMAAVKKLAAVRGRGANQIALAWLLHQSFPSFAIVGANSPARVADSCGAADISLSTGEIRILEADPDQAAE